MQGEKEKSGKNPAFLTPVLARVAILILIALLVVLIFILIVLLVILVVLLIILILIVLVVLVLLVLLVGVLVFILHFEDLFFIFRCRGHKVVCAVTQKLFVRGKVHTNFLIFPPIYATIKTEKQKKRCSYARSNRH